MRPTLFVFVALCVVAACRAAVADEEYEYEDEATPIVVTQAPTRPAGRLGLLSARARPVPAAKKPIHVTSTTAKPVAQTVEEENEEDGEFVEDSEEGAEAQMTTTTESSKKRLGGGIRPFRSNQDLLAALKRRRAQTGVSVHTTSTTQSNVDVTTHKSKSNSGGRSRNGAVTEASSRASTRGRFGVNTRSNKPLQEEVEETQREEVQFKSKPYRRG